MHHHKWPIEFIDNLIPFEKEIYVNLLVSYIEEENERIRDQQAHSKR